MKTWNYRVVAAADYAYVIEAFYDEDGNVEMYSEVNSVVGNDIADLHGEVMHLVEAFSYPVLTEADLPKDVETTEPLDTFILRSIDEVK